MFAPFTRPECRSSGQIGDKSCLYSDPKRFKNIKNWIYLRRWLIAKWVFVFYLLWIWTINFIGRWQVSFLTNNKIQKSSIIDDQLNPTESLPDLVLFWKLLWPPRYFWKFKKNVQTSTVGVWQNEIPQKIDWSFVICALEQRLSLKADKLIFSCSY